LIAIASESGLGGGEIVAGKLGVDVVSYTGKRQGRCYKAKREEAVRHGFMINDATVLEFPARKSVRNRKPVFSFQFPVLSSAGLLH
jgi:hypothetical protein